MKEKKTRIGLIAKIILIALAAVFVTAAVLVTISVIRLRATYESLIVEELKATAHHLDSQLSNEYDGDWSLSEDGTLYKGDAEVSAVFEAEMDELHSKTGVDYTLFYGDTRIITTIRKKGTTERLVGTKASDAVIAQVLNGGSEFSATNLNIEGIKYMGYYCPLTNTDGSVVGMCFTGRASEDVSQAISGIIFSLIIIAAIIVAGVLIIGLLLNHRVSSQMKNVSEGLTSLAEGNLETVVDSKISEREDELGDIGGSTIGLIDRISDIIKKTKQMSDELSRSGTDLAKSAEGASEASARVATSVEDISKGAISQADSIQTAAHETDTMDSNIAIITESINNLNGASEEMEGNCRSTKDALDTLIVQSKKVADSVVTISGAIDKTNKSAYEISQFTEAINAIATQTNLLSLNASIEAARAGESGKGFAVVAGEISSLATQSKESADKINEIITSLIEGVEDTGEVMKVLAANCEEQGKQLDATKESMDEMAKGINNVAMSADEISDKIKELERAKEILNGIIQDLSAISEENAASSEETTASMQELSATFSVITDSAESLKELAADMSETISYFT